MFSEDQLVCLSRCTASAYVYKIVGMIDGMWVVEKSVDRWTGPNWQPVWSFAESTRRRTDVCVTHYATVPPMLYALGYGEPYEYGAGECWVRSLDDHDRGIRPQVAL